MNEDRHRIAAAHDALQRRQLHHLHAALFVVMGCGAIVLIASVIAALVGFE